MPDDDLTNFKAMASLQDLVDQGVAASVEGGVVHAKLDGPLKDLALWTTGDTPHDMDQLDVRPTVDGTPDYAGADVP